MKNNLKIIFNFRDKATVIIITEVNKVTFHTSFIVLLLKPLYVRTAVAKIPYVKDYINIIQIIN